MSAASPNFRGGVVSNPVNASEPVPQTIDITVNYVANDADKTVLWLPPYKATIPIGYAEPVTVELPVVAGFTAKSSDPTPVEGFTLGEDTFTLDFSKFTENTVINILYEPNEVPYTVEHLLQKLDTTGYETHETETKQGSVKQSRQKQKIMKGLV